MEYLLFLPLFGPGLALVFWLMADQEFTLFDRLILGLGVSLAFYPIFLLLFHIAGLPVNAPVIGTLVAVSWLGLLWQLLPHLRKLSSTVRQPLALKLEATTLAWLFLAIVLALSAYVRVAVVKDLKIPMWADSYHHTMISQLMIDNNGLFSSWLPYAPLKTFTYHFGFHSLVASYHWLTGVTMPRAVIVTGQIISMVVVLGCYLLAKYLTGKVWAGNVAALFVGLISPMPAYYFNWGRYTQLTGLAVLPIAMVLLVYVLNQKTFNRGVIFLTGFTIAGLGLAHYAVAVFFVLFGIVFTGSKLIEIRFEKSRLTQLASRLIVIAMIAGLLAAPWLWNVLSGQLMLITTTIIKQAPGAKPEKIQAHNAIGHISNYLSMHWYYLVIIGALWSLWHRAKYTILVSIWAISLIALANPHYLKLPGTGLINNFAVFITLFMPFSVILGNFLADMIKKMRIWQPWSANLLLLLLLLLGLWGARFRLALFQPDRQLVTDSDLAAMAWIEENTPPEAKFLINHTFAYHNSSVVGTDAGWWLPLLAHRENIILPLSFQEQPIDPDGFQYNRFFRQVDEADLSHISGYTLLKEAGITHIYLGQQNGQVWNETGQPPLDAELLRASRFYREIYRQDQVSVFALEPSPPESQQTHAD
jgi:hypothetical protein